MSGTFIVWLLPATPSGSRFQQKNTECCLPSTKVHTGKVSERWWRDFDVASVCWIWKSAVFCHFISRWYYSSCVSVPSSPKSINAALMSNSTVRWTYKLIAVLSMQIKSKPRHSVNFFEKALVLREMAEMVHHRVYCMYINSLRLLLRHIKSFYIFVQP